MDAEIYRRMLCSKNFSSVSKTLREEIAIFTQNLLTLSYHPSLLEAYIVSRLIPLDKNPGISPIGVGEVLGRIVCKMVSWHVKEEVKDVAGLLQTCAGHSAGAESAVHAMREIFEDEHTDAVLLTDASNAFNCMNRYTALHNVQIICPIIAAYLSNTYRHPARLFIQGGEITYLKKEQHKVTH